jgi:hypothetical protein
MQGSGSNPGHQKKKRGLNIVDYSKIKIKKIDEFI